MRPVLSLLCCLLLMVALPTRAQTAIHRCVAANGDPVFTDQPCAALAATPALPPAPAPGTAGGAATVRAPALLCARDGMELRQVVADAFATRDANRLAGVMWWAGYGRDAVVAGIRTLAGLVREPLLQVTTLPAGGNATATASPGEAAAAPPAVLVLETSGADTPAPGGRRFDVVQRAGCLWLRPGDRNAG